MTGNQSLAVPTFNGRDSGYGSGEYLSKSAESSSTYAPALQHEEIVDTRGLHRGHWTTSQILEDQLIPSETNNAENQPPPAFPLSVQ